LKECAQLHGAAQGATLVLLQLSVLLLVPPQ
jgi:hypothetical protein